MHSEPTNHFHEDTSILFDKQLEAGYPESKEGCLWKHSTERVYEDNVYDLDNQLAV